MYTHMCVYIIIYIYIYIYVYTQAAVATALREEPRSDGSLCAASPAAAASSDQSTVNLCTKLLDVRGFDSGIILISGVEFSSS